LRKTAETEISDLTFWLRFGSVRVFINRNRTEIRFPHIPISYANTKNCKGDDSTAQGNIKEWGHTNKSKSTNEHTKHKPRLNTAKI